MVAVGGQVNRELNDWARDLIEEDADEEAKEVGDEAYN